MTSPSAAACCASPTGPAPSYARAAPVRAGALSPALESLTPAERQVADLAAAGHSNREIAQRLYVTRRTVETHLTHVFAKLGISGRSELVDLFAHAAPTVHQP